LLAWVARLTVPSAGLRKRYGIAPDHPREANP
jgi:hypothetical protein